MEKYLFQELSTLGQKHWWFTSKKKIVLSLVEKYLEGEVKDNKILDIGCGSGFMLDSLRKFGTVYGMDTSDEAIALSRQVFDGEIKKGFLPDDLPFPKESFNLILALDVLEHVAEDRASLDGICAHLKDDGVFIITVPAYMFLWSHHDVVHAHQRRYKFDELQDKLKNSGFEILKISYLNSLLFLPIFLVRKFNNLMKRKKGSDAKMPNKYVNILFEKIFSFEKYLLGLMNFPFGVSLVAVVRKKK